MNESHIMLDGWVMSYVFKELSDDGNHLQDDLKKQCMSSLITGVLLWDKIDWISDSLVAIKKEGIYIPKNLSEILVDHTDIPDFNKFTSCSPFDEYIKEHENFQYESESERKDFNELVKRASFYLNYCDQKGINYFPHPARAEFIKRKNLMNNLYDFRVQNIIFDKVDSELKKYYDEVSIKIGRNLNCAYPVLYDYIRKQSNSPIEQLNKAFELRNRNDVKELRNELNKLDKQFNDGHIGVIETAVVQIEDLSIQIMNDCAKENKVGDLSIGLTPSSLTSYSDSSQKNKVLNLTFLTELLVFGKDNRLTSSVREEKNPKKYVDIIFDNIEKEQELSAKQIVNGITKFNNVKSVEYDVFISHASEDKDSFVKPFYETLNAKGIKVFYDDVSIEWGASLRKEIDIGLAKSKLAIVVLSHNFFLKKWTGDELDGLFAIETTSKIILPLWHGVSKDDVSKYSPLLAGRKALKTSDFTFDEIGDMLLKILNKEKIGIN